MSSELDRQAMIDIFVMEASEAAAALSAAVNPAGEALPSAEEIQNQYVWAHKVRGAAGIYGFTGLSTLGALLENTLEQATAIESASWPKRRASAPRPSRTSASARLASARSGQNWEGRYE